MTTGRPKTEDVVNEQMKKRAGMFADEQTGINPFAQLPEETKQAVIQQGLTALASADNLVIGGMRFTKTGLVQVDILTEDGLRLIGDVLHQFKSSFSWLIADWLNQVGIYEWADVDRVAKHFRLSAKTLQNWKSISSNVPHSQRRERLDFNHHAEVAALPEDKQAYWLERAELGDEVPDEPDKRIRWSVARLRKEIGIAGLPPVYAPPLLDKSFRRTFGKLWRNAERGSWDKITSKDISALKGWLITLEEEKKLQASRDQDNKKK